MASASACSTYCRHLGLQKSLYEKPQLGGLSVSGGNARSCCLLVTALVCATAADQTPRVANNCQVTRLSKVPISIVLAHAVVRTSGASSITVFVHRLDRLLSTFWCNFTGQPSSAGDVVDDEQDPKPLISSATPTNLVSQLGSTVLLISPFFFWGTSMVAMKVTPAWSHT